MRTLAKLSKLSALLGSLVFGFGCKHKNSAPPVPPVPAPPSIAFTSPLGGHRVTLIDDVTDAKDVASGFIHDMSNLPPAQFDGLTTLHRSKYMEELAANLYQRLSSSERDEWVSIVGPGKDPAAEWAREYRSWLSDGYNVLFDNFLHDVDAGRTAAAQEYLFMMTQFAFRSGQTNQFWGYLPGPRPDFPSFDPRVIPISVVNGQLGIYSVKFDLATVNGAQSIVSDWGKSVPPLPIPAIFIQDAMMGSLQKLNASVTDESLKSVISDPFMAAPKATIGGSPVSPLQPAKQIYISPDAPSVYRPVVDSAVQNTFIREMNELKKDPASTVLNHASGAVPHGFKLDPVSVPSK